MFGTLSFLRGRLARNKRSHHVELTPESSGLTPEQIVTAQKAILILALDDRSNELTKQDVVTFLYAMGMNPTDDVIDSKIRGLQLQHNHSFTFGQLTHLWHSMLQDLTDEEELLRRAFQFFDKDGNGEISVQELKTTMHELGDLLSEEEMAAFMDIMDVNNDGAIGYTEFLASLKTQVASTNLYTAASLRRPPSSSELPSSRSTGLNSTRQYDPQPLNVPACTTPLASPSPNTQQQAPDLALTVGGAAAAGVSAAEGTQRSGELERAPGLAALAAAGQGAMRRQPSLRPNLAPSPAVAAGPLLDGAALPVLQRPPSRRLGSHSQLPTLVRSPSRRRSNDAAYENGLRAPSSLEQSTVSAEAPGNSAPMNAS